MLVGIADDQAPVLGHSYRGTGVVGRGEAPVGLGTNRRHLDVAQWSRPTGEGHHRQESVAQVAELLGEDARAQQYLRAPDQPVVAPHQPRAAGVFLECADWRLFKHFDVAGKRITQATYQGSRLHQVATGGVDGAAVVAATEYTG
ncbi:hypothetical protein D9M71_304160 [compost metagenome]